MDELIKILKDIENDNSIESKECLTEGYADSFPKIINNAVSLACENLIGESGSINTTNINTLRKNGFGVYPGDRDSFGWLVGCIRTSKGVITFG